MGLGKQRRWPKFVSLTPGPSFIAGIVGLVNIFDGSLQCRNAPWMRLEGVPVYHLCDIDFAQKVQHHMARKINNSIMSEIIYI